jgi:hypothetical protein
MDLIRQKTDIITNNIVQYKDRDSLESIILPTSKVIKSINSSDNEIFVDNAEFFNYEENNFDLNISSFDAVIIDPITQVSAALTATVSTSSTISSINIIDGTYNINGYDIMQNTSNFIIGTSNILMQKINELLNRIELLENM